MLVGALIGRAWSLPTPVELERHRTLLNPGAQSVLGLRAAQAGGGSPLAFGLVREDSTRAPSGWNLGSGQIPLWIEPVAALEARLAGDTDRVVASEGGVRASGRLGSLWFSTDARIFVEDHTDLQVASWDGEAIDRSEEGDLSNATFTSWARYRSAVEWSSPIGALGFRKDAPHWGPGVRGNLALNGKGIAFPHMYWQGQFGSVSIESMWGSLSIDGEGQYRLTHDTRSLYAHRYEWRPVADFSVGISEILILHNQESIASLVPFVPLFIEKGGTVERENNGSIAFDLAWRRWQCLFHAEFLIDDMQEPTSLFSDRYWGNRWASNLGVVWSAPSAGKNTWTAASLEWTRVEPWIYTHFQPGSAQALHMGRPIGNQDGPNSQSIRAQGEWRGLRQGVSLGGRAFWKGGDEGSSVTDTVGARSRRGKSFLAGVDTPEWIPEMEAWKKIGWVALHTMASWEGNALTLRLRLQSAM
ncbi:MAG: hypothetical protein IPK50_00020 [Fibrobacterota bacterium]|nr:hypothetical protein [Fibrobacterota bacterium]QQS05313.1 MAG: hypothetical protein IPK50_00020 [Fibrobacterota bacterium]